jgi:hypothetical protein
MHYEEFDDWKNPNKYLQGASEATLEKANAIIAEYQAQGYVLSLRQLYYRMVVKNFIPNVKNSYKRLGEILSRGRTMGLVDWEALEDRVRSVRGFGNEVEPESYMNDIHDAYREDIWYDQDAYVLFLYEKDALSGVMERVCGKWRVPILACRGYNSTTECFNLGKRLSYFRNMGKTLHVFHIGDHDPSGMQMTDDNEYRIGVYMRDPDFKLTRLALNMDQIRKFNPPPQPNKTTDSREPNYRLEHGVNSWEVDALDPSQLTEIIDAAVEPICDKEKFDAAIAKEDRNRARIEIVGKYFNEAEQLISTHRIL